jgi:hypothetical protein
MTRNRRTGQLTIEKLAHDCLDVRFLRRKGFFADSGITIGPSLKWPPIARMRVARYAGCRYDRQAMQSSHRAGRLHFNAKS